MFVSLERNDLGPPHREIYFNIPYGHWVIYIPAAIAGAIFILGVVRRLKMWRQGKPERRDDGLFRRLVSALFDTFTQRLVLRYPGPGIFHAMIFWGFVVLFIGTLVVMVEADLGITTLGKGSVFGDRFYPWFKVFMDAFGLAVILGVSYSLCRRYLWRSAYLDERGDDWLVLVLILAVVISGHMIQALRLAVERPPWAGYSFFSSLLARPLGGLAPPVLLAAHEVVWWVHMLLAMAWIAYLPYSKLWHIFSGPSNLTFRSTRHRGRMSMMDLEDEEAESFGLGRLEDISWKQLLDSDACIRCGRCQENCPAHLTGKKLNPKQVILNLREHMQEVYRLGRGDGRGNEANRRDLHGEVVSAEELWACTTCRACESNCPMGIEHLDLILGMRRNRILMESAFPRELVRSFKGMENNANPWAIGSGKRLDWAEGLGLKPLSEKPEHEILFWVGCAGSFDARAINVSRALVKIMQAADIDFAVLGIEEGCCGDTARRLGNEYLAQMLIKKNVETLNRYGVKRIVTICPHGYNTFKHEYPDFGGKYEVIHHTQLIARLLAEKRIHLKGEPLGTVAFHDSCYLGRYNGLFRTPRRLLEAVPGAEICEAARNRRRGFCCGAGGGRMWIEERSGRRVYTERCEQLLAGGADKIAVACPYCLTMLEDGLKAKNQIETHAVLDIAEIVARYLA